MHKTTHKQKEEVQVGMHTRDKMERTHPRAVGSVWLSASGFTGNNALVRHLQYVKCIWLFHMPGKFCGQRWGVM